jgi:hypothetical protein
MAKWIITIVLLGAVSVFEFYLFVIAGYSAMAGERLVSLCRIAALPLIAVGPVIIAIFSFGKVPKKWSFSLLGTGILLPLIVYTLQTRANVGSTIGASLTSFQIVIRYFFRFFNVVPGLILSYFILKGRVSKKTLIISIIGLYLAHIWIPVFLYWVYPTILNLSQGLDLVDAAFREASRFIIVFFIGKAIISFSLKRENLPEDQVYLLSWKTSIAMITLTTLMRWAFRLLVM